MKKNLISSLLTISFFLLGFSNSAICQFKNESTGNEQGIHEDDEGNGEEDEEESPDDDEDDGPRGRMNGFGTSNLENRLVFSSITYDGFEVTLKPIENIDESMSFYLLDLQGNLIQSGKAVLHDSQLFKLNINGLEHGIYIFSILGSDGILKSMKFYSR